MKTFTAKLETAALPIINFTVNICQDLFQDFESIREGSCFFKHSRNLRSTPYNAVVDLFTWSIMFYYIRHFTVYIVNAQK